MIISNDLARSQILFKQFKFLIGLDLNWLTILMVILRIRKRAYNSPTTIWHTHIFFSFKQFKFLIGLNLNWLTLLIVFLRIRGKKAYDSPMLFFFFVCLKSQFF